MTGLNHLVVGVDGSDGARRALEWSAAQSSVDRLTIVHGFSPGVGLLASAFQIDFDLVRAERRELLDTNWSEPARAAGTEFRTVLVDESAADALTHVAASHSADAIAIGHQGHSRWSQRHVGDTAGRLLHRCDVPLILTSDQTPAQPLGGVIVVGLTRPVDDTKLELSWALDVAERSQTGVHLVTLIEPTPFVDAKYPLHMDRVQAGVQSQMDSLVETLRGQRRSIGVSSDVRQGPALEELAAVATETDAAMVVVGSHHPGALAGVLAGSIARLLPPLLSCPMAAIPIR